MVVTSSLAELGAWLLRRRLRFDFRPIGDPTRARSWRWFVRGLTVARSAYGENTKRWYRRGLTPADKLKWEVVKLADYKAYHRATDARVRADAIGSLLPPRMWILSRGIRRGVGKLAASASTPEAVTNVMPELLALASRIGEAHTVRRRSLSTVDREVADAHLSTLRARNAARTDRFDPEKSSPPFLKGEVSEVVDNSGSFEERTRRRAEAMMRAPPDDPAIVRAEAEEAEASEKHRSDFLAQRANKKIADALNRLRELVERRTRETTGDVDSSRVDRKGPMGK